MIEDERFKKAWEEFKAMRKKKKKPLTEAAETRQMNRVEKLYKAMNNNIDALVDHLHVVVDSCWDNVYTNDEHFQNIINQYGGTTIKSNGSNNGSGSATKQTGTNFFNYQKDSAYFAAAEGLRTMCEGFDFVTKVAEA